MVLYAAGLLFSVELTSGAAPQPVAIEPQTAVAVAAVAEDTESPIVTIALVATALVVVGAVRAARSARRQAPRTAHRPLAGRVTSPTT